MHNNTKATKAAIIFHFQSYGVIEIIKDITISYRPIKKPFFKFQTTDYIFDLTLVIDKNKRATLEVFNKLTEETSTI